VTEVEEKCTCGHEWWDHTLEAGCQNGWEYKGPDPGIASKDGCYCRLAHVDESPRD